MPHGSDVDAYNTSMDHPDRAIGELLTAHIERVLSEATGKRWHRQPVWFLGGNPVVGYNRLRAGMRLMFWSGQSFTSPGLDPSGSFQAATTTYASADEIDAEALAVWLAESRTVQWDDEHIRTNRGLVKRTTL